MTRALHPVEPPPLLIWPVLRQIEVLRARRDRLKERIALLRPHCHRRIVLQAEMEQVVIDLLKAQVGLKSSAIDGTSKGVR